MTTPEALYHDPAFARLYDSHCPWSADTEYCLGLARQVTSVLDFGCGTGRFCATVAALGHAAVRGVDPAPAMLAIARARPQGDRVTWTNGDAGTVRLGRRFDLIVMTGHAFQTLLTASDRAAALAGIAAHLTPGGHFIFDSRNPAAREWANWTPDQTRETFTDAALGSVETWTDTSWDAASQIATYETHYAIPAENRTIAARARIAFPAQPDLAAQIAAAGLTVERWLGEWDSRRFTADAPEIIPFGRRTRPAAGA